MTTTNTVEAARASADALLERLRHPDLGENPVVTRSRENEFWSDLLGQLRPEQSGPSAAPAAVAALRRVAASADSDPSELAVLLRELPAFLNATDPDYDGEAEVRAALAESHAGYRAAVAAVTAAEAAAHPLQPSSPATATPSSTTAPTTPARNPMTAATTARAELADLEQAILDGVEVAPSRLAEAREAVTIADLVARGDAARAEQARAAAQAAAQAEAKQQAVTTLRGITATVHEAYDAAVAALETLIATNEQHNDSIGTVARLFDRAKVPAKAMWLPDDHPADLDPENYAAMNQGGRPYAVISNGVTYIPTEPGALVRHLVARVAHAHSGLRIGGQPSMSRLVGMPSSTTEPFILKNRPSS